MTNKTVDTVQSFDFQLDEFYLDLQEDGRNISILSAEEIANRPFPGLRPFKTSEFQLFRGRSGQAEELIKRLKRNRFLAVIGSSGTGKSSLVRAGLIPELFGGSLREAGSKWNIAVCRPGKNPVANLAIALSSVKGESKNKELLHQNFETIEPLLNSSLFGLLEVNEFINTDQTKDDQTNLLIIVDQFEEIFRYDRKDLGRENIENHFVNLLLKAASNAASPVYVIITMRSEFLGDCVKYRGLPEAINEGQYLVPGLNRTQLKDVIEGPIKAAGKSIAPGLVELLINELDEAKARENLDQLPILQHALMRTYQEATREGSTEINYEHYRRIGGMEKALANHAKEMFDELGDGNETDNVYSKKQKIAKIIFQALTDASTDLKGGRRPTELKNIYAIATAIGATQQEVDEVIDKFRDNETSFIMPPINTELHDDLIMDISHESLMRNWDSLKGWIDEEVRYGKFYQKLNERREEEGQFIQGSLLADLLNWRENYPHNAAWASRYHDLPKGQNKAAAQEDLYQENLLFLQRSEEAAVAAKDAERKIIAEEERQQREEDLRLQKEKSRKRLMWFLTSALLVAIGLVFWAFSEMKNADREREKAKANFSIAEEQRKRAVALNTELVRQTKAAEGAREAAVGFANKLNIQTQELQKKNTALNYQKGIIQQKSILLAQKSAELEHKKIELEKHLAEGWLHGREFYTSKSTSAKEKDAIVPYLFTQPLSEVQIDYKKYIRQDLLNEVDAAVKARDTLLEAPVTGLRMAKAVWERNKNQPVMQLVLPDIFKKNIFHAAKINLSQVDLLTSDPYAYATSSDGTRFGFASKNQIVLGRFSGAEPEIENLIETKYALSNGKSEEAETSINAMSFGADNTVAALINDSLVMQWKGKEKSRLITLRGSEGLTTSEFSPDASSLVTVMEDTVVRVWPVSSGRNNGVLSPDTVKNFRGLKNFRQVVFSPNSRKLLLVFDNGFGVYDLAAKTFQKQSERSRFGTVANFSGDGKFVLMTAANQPNVLSVCNPENEKCLDLRIFSSVSDDNFSTARISDLSVLPNRTKLLVNKGGTLLLYERENGEALYSASESYRGYNNADFRNMRSRKLFSFGEEVIKAKFLDSSTVIALTSGGNTYIWKLKPPSASLDAAFEDVRPITDLSFKEKKEEGELTFRQIMSSGQKNLLQQAGVYYSDMALNNDTLATEEADKLADTAKRIYKRLSEIDSGFAGYGALNKLTALNEKLSSDEQNKPRPDTLTLIELLGENTKTREQMLNLRPESIDNRNLLSLDYWNLSWLLNFKKRYTVAIQCAKRGVELNAANNGIYTNLAIAYLLKGDFVAAEKIYAQYKDSLYADGSGTQFKDSFLKDLNDLQAADVITKDNVPLYKEMLRIRSDILKESDRTNPKPNSKMGKNISRQ